MTDESRLEQGRRVTRKLFGEKRAQIVEDAVGNMSPDFAKFVMEGFGIYENPQLDMKTRSTITIAILTALGRSQELVGKEELEVEIEEGASVADLCLKLAKDFPELEDDFHTLMIAVNAVQGDWEYILSDGDKVDFISTLGGG